MLVRVWHRTVRLSSIWRWAAGHVAPAGVLLLVGALHARGEALGALRLAPRHAKSGKKNANRGWAPKRGCVSSYGELGLSDDVACVCMCFSGLLLRLQSGLHVVTTNDQAISCTPGRPDRGFMWCWMGTASNTSPWRLGATRAVWAYPEAKREPGCEDHLTLSMRVQP